MADGEIDREALTERFEARVAELQAGGVNLCLPPSGPRKGLDAALRLLASRGMITMQEDRVVLSGAFDDLLPYYARSIAQFVPRKAQKSAPETAKS